LFDSFLCIHYIPFFLFIEAAAMFTNEQVKYQQTAEEKFGQNALLSRT
jgi:hypothetical protein